MNVTINDWTVILRPDKTVNGDCIRAFAYIEKDNGTRTNLREFVDYDCKTQKQMLRKVKYYLEYKDNGGREL